MKEVIVSVEGFSFSSGGIEILRDISFTVARGEYLSIVGPNGAGKTTLLKCLSRIHLGGTGNISIAGKSVLAYRQKELARILTYVPQSNGHQSPFTVFEYVAMARYPYLSPFSSLGARDKKAVSEALDITDTNRLADRFLDTLSGGERQKVYVAAALAQQAEVLLLDEPTTFLDPRHERDIQQLLCRANRERKATIIAVTHDINRAVSVSERLVAIKDGSVVFDGATGEFMSNVVLEQIYAKPFVLVAHPDNGKKMIVPECL